MNIFTNFGLSAVLLSGTILLTSCSSSKPPESGATDEYKPVITHTAVLVTDKGEIELELYGEDAPKTVYNFVELAKQDVYDDILFHRVVKDFVIQGGDPKSKDLSQKPYWGQGGTSVYGGMSFVDELNPEAPSYKRGYVKGALAMANAGPNTNSSQFFIVTKNAGLPHAYTIFGFVRSGMDVVHLIEEGVGAPPKNPVKILDIRVKEYKKIPKTAIE
ncbi:MAG: peptidylprolyl isomerase [Candidatus Kapaibacterium sp.]